MNVNFTLEVQFDIVTPVAEMLHSSARYTPTYEYTKEGFAYLRRNITLGGGEILILFDLKNYPETMLTETFCDVTFDVTDAPTRGPIISFDVMTPDQIFNRTRTLEVGRSRIVGSKSAGVYSFMIVPKLAGSWKMQYKQEFQETLFGNNGINFWWKHIGFEEYAVYVREPASLGFSLLGVVSAEPWRYTYA